MIIAIIIPEAILGPYKFSIFILMKFKYIKIAGINNKDQYNQKETFGNLNFKFLILKSF